MATPYFQIRRERVPSTQDVARESIEELPVLVVASTQSAGRGRVGAAWENADRALAASYAFHIRPGDHRPFSLIAGVAAARVINGASLKWPNDVLLNGTKVGGILVERSQDLVVVGMGVNLYWPEPGADATGLFDQDPGPESHAELGAVWGAELNRLLDRDDWPRDEYLRRCVTVGRRISWEPNGEGSAVGIDSDGALIVETQSGRRHLRSGSVRHIRST